MATDKKQSSDVGIFLFILFFIGCIGYCTSNKSSETKNENIISSDDMKLNAYLFSKEFVKDELKAPHTAVFPDADYQCQVSEPDSVYTVSSYVDSQNSFGASIRNRYNVELKYTGGNIYDGSNWTLLGVRLYDEN